MEDHLKSLYGLSESKARLYNEMTAALTTVAHHLRHGMGYNVVAIYVQGSQNYELDINNDNYSSDIDMKAFVIPSIEDLYLEKKVSRIYGTEYGQVEVKDIRLIVELLKKTNLTYLELLNTQYALYPRFNSEVDEVWEDVRAVLYGGSGESKFINRLVSDRRTAFLNAFRGTAKAKYDGVFKSTESSLKTLLEYGYQPKELHHLCRLYFMAVDLFKNNKLLSDSYIPSEENKETLIKIKTGEYFEKLDVHAVDVLAKSLMTSIDNIMNPLLEICPKSVSDTSINELEGAVFRAVIKSIQRGWA